MSDGVGKAQTSAEFAGDAPLTSVDSDSDLCVCMSKSCLSHWQAKLCTPAGLRP